MIGRLDAGAGRHALSTEAHSKARERFTRLRLVVIDSCARLTPPSSSAEGREARAPQRGEAAPPVLRSAAEGWPALCRLQRSC